jgi:hypothetical protein
MNCRIVHAVASVLLVTFAWPLAAQITFVNAPDTVAGTLGIPSDEELTAAWGVRNDGTTTLNLRVVRSIVEEPEVLNCPQVSGAPGSYDRFCWGPICYTHCAEASGTGQTGLVAVPAGATNWTFYADFYPAGIAGNATYRYCFQPLSGVQPWSCRNVTFAVHPLVGCTYPTAVNFNSAATEDDGSCAFAGCTDPAALNYHPLFSVSDGSCVYLNTWSTCPADLDGDAHVGLGDLLLFLSAFGESCAWD